jgi:hypothetical protein
MLSRIIVVSDGGLANRIRPIFSAMALAELVGLAYSDVSVYWKPSPVCDASLTDVIDTPLEEVGEDFIGGLEKESILLYREGSLKNAINDFKRKDIARLGNKCRKQSIESISSVEDYTHELINCCRTLVVFDNQLLGSSPSLKNLYMKKIRSLKFTREIEDFASFFCAQNKLNKGSLAVHARGTDFLTPFSYYSRKICLEDLSAPWFFASDSRSFDHLAAKKFKNMIIREKISVDHSAGFLGFGESLFRSRQSIIDAAIDLRILSSLNLKIFHPNSTFGLLASECGSAGIREDCRELRV